MSKLKEKNGKPVIHSTEEWFRLNIKKPGCNKLNLKYLREYKAVREELAKAVMMLWFLKVELNIEYMRTMLNSGAKQGLYIRLMIDDLKVWQIDSEYERIFRDDVKKLNERINTINRIVRENIHLTEYEPAFDAIGYETLEVDHIPTYEEIVSGQNSFEGLKETLEEWNRSHPENVSRHMQNIQPELERRAKFKQKLKDEHQAEVKARREARRAERAEIREMLENEKRYNSRQKKIEREFARYYR